MAGKYSVGSHFTQAVDLPLQSITIDRRAQSPEIVVHTSSVQLDMSAVQEKAFVRAKLDLLKSEASADRVDRLVIFQKRYLVMIEVWVIEKVNTNKSKAARREFNGLQVIFGL